MSGCGRDGRRGPGPGAVALSQLCTRSLTARLGRPWSPARAPTPILLRKPSACPADRGSGGRPRPRTLDNSGELTPAVGRLRLRAWSVVLFSLGSPSTGPFGQAYFVSETGRRLPPWSGRGCGVPGTLGTPSRRCLGLLVAPWPSATLPEPRCFLHVVTWVLGVQDGGGEGVVWSP